MIIKNKSYIIGIIFILVSVNLYSQNNNAKFGYSINVGLEYSNMIGNGINNDTRSINYPPNTKTYSDGTKNFTFGKKIGFGLVKDLNRDFLLAFDFNYEEKGCKVPIHSLTYSTSLGVYETYNLSNEEMSYIKLKYLTIPVKIEKQIKHFYFQSGIYFGLILAASNHGDININNQVLDYKTDKKSSYSNEDVGVLFGSGILIPILKNNILKLGIVGNWSIIGSDRNLTSYIPIEKDSNKIYNQSFIFEIRFEKQIKGNRTSCTL